MKFLVKSSNKISKESLYECFACFSCKVCIFKCGNDCGELTRECNNFW